MWTHCQLSLMITALFDSLALLSCDACCWWSLPAILKPYLLLLSDFNLIGVTYSQSVMSAGHSQTVRDETLWCLTGSSLSHPSLVWFSLRNASGQTAADLAHTHGFLDCFRFISKTQKQLLQLSGLHVNGVQNGSRPPCGQGLLSRKRLLTALDTDHMKKARRADSRTVFLSLFMWAIMMMI